MAGFDLLDGLELLFEYSSRTSYEWDNFLRVYGVTCVFQLIEDKWLPQVGGYGYNPLAILIGCLGGTIGLYLRQSRGIMGGVGYSHLGMYVSFSCGPIHRNY